MLSTSFNVLLDYLKSDIPPTRVVAVKPENYSTRHIYIREDALILYKPTPGNKKEKYEIVLHRPYTDPGSQAFSVFRSNNQDEAEIHFIRFKDILPMLVDVSKEIQTVAVIQKICNAINEHHSWNVAHLAAHFGFLDILKHPKINQFINVSDPLDGASPIQIALKTNNLKVIQILLELKCDLEHLDHKANTIFHYAANTSKEIIFALNASSSKCLNYINNEGYTALHKACLENNTDCVNALLLVGADVNKPAVQTNSNLESTPGYVGDFIKAYPKKLFEQDMKSGGTPLHWSSSPEVVEALADRGCNINALNFDNRTALHIMALRNRLHCLVALLSRGVDINIADNEGNSPLHLAVKVGNPALVQALIVFDADINFKNGAGVTPRHLASTIYSTEMNKILYILHSVGAQRCSSDVMECEEGCKQGGSFDGIPPPPIFGPQNRNQLNELLNAVCIENAAPKAKKKGSRLLCLDGGGIRGLVLIQMLIEIERIVNKPIIHCFDWIAGTSTGGILALGMAMGKSMKECQCLYFSMKEKAFKGTRPYGSEGLDMVLQEAFGSTTLMTDIKGPKVMITGVMADRKPVDLHLFRNYESPFQLLNLPYTDERFTSPVLPKEQRVWETARATGAAPTYFNGHGNYLDGGLIANNPTLDALTEIHEYNAAMKSIGRGEETNNISLVVSLGTGLIPVTPLLLQCDFESGTIRKTYKLIFGYKDIKNLLIDQATATDGRVVDRARAWCSMIGIPFFRYTPQLSNDVAMDEKNDEILVNMLWETKVYMHENITSIQQLAELLNSYE